MERASTSQRQVVWCEKARSLERAKRQVARPEGFDILLRKIPTRFARVKQARGLVCRVNGQNVLMAP